MKHTVRFAHVLADHKCHKCEAVFLRLTKAPVVNGKIGDAQPADGLAMCNDCERKARLAEDARLNRRRQFRKSKALTLSSGGDDAA